MVEFLFLRRQDKCFMVKLKRGSFSRNMPRHRRHSTSQKQKTTHQLVKQHWGRACQTTHYLMLDVIFKTSWFKKRITWNCIPTGVISSSQNLYANLPLKLSLQFVFTRIYNMSATCSARIRSEMFLCHTWINVSSSIFFHLHEYAQCLIRWKTTSWGLLFIT